MDVNTSESIGKAASSSENPKPSPTAEAIINAALSIVHHSKSSKKKVVIMKCEVCNIELTGQCVIDAHMAGSKHAKKVKAQQQLTSLAGSEGNIFKCDLCNIILNSSQQLELHLSGSKHKQKLSKGQNSYEQATAWSFPNGQEGQNETNPLTTDEGNSAAASTSATASENLKPSLINSRKKGRAAPYPRQAFRAAGLGSSNAQETPRRGSKFTQYTSLSNSFKSAGYSNSFIKAEGGVTLPKTPASYGPTKPSMSLNKNDIPTEQNRHKGNFGSLAPYINTESHGFKDNKGGFWATSSGGAVAVASQPVQSTAYSLGGDGANYNSMPQVSSSYGYGYDYEAYYKSYYYTGADTSY